MTRESKQAQALLRVFEALGVPLIGAVGELMAWQSPSGGYAEEDAAKSFAALLSASITSGTQLSSKLAPPTQDEADNIRLKTSTLAGTLIAQNYVLTGQLPDEAFNRRVASAFDGMLGLADSFALLPDEDAGETDLVAARVEALTPFVQAVMRFPFGMDDNSVIRTLGEKLCDKATALADAFSGGPSYGPDLFAQREVSFLKGCAKLLARSCEIEMDRIQQAMTQGQMQQPPAPEAVMDQIWRRFEDGLDVLRAVIGFMSGPAVPSYAPSTKAAPASAPAAPPEKPAEKEKPQGNPSNPMSFFVKKTDDSKSGEAA
ncbi:MAG: hypothetical protein EBQ96_07225 [Proteobacteria bacterium]|nr:hypothetical protein [Pseudomonadota bacterium]